MRKKSLNCTALGIVLKSGRFGIWLVPMRSAWGSSILLCDCTTSHLQSIVPSIVQLYGGFGGQEMMKFLDRKSFLEMSFCETFGLRLIC